MPTPSIDTVLAEVDAWFAEQMQQPPISHSVEAYNQAFAAKGNLKSRLTELITGEPSAASADAVTEAVGDEEAVDTKSDRGATKA